MTSSPTEIIPLKILIVEDEPLLAMDLESFLADLKQIVVGIADDAERAFAIADANAPDLALIDVNLRDGASGPEIARRLANTNQTLVVFITGNPEEIPDDYAGAYGAITKPWNSQSIESLLAFASAYRSGAVTLDALDPPIGVRLAAHRQRS